MMHIDDHIVKRCAIIAGCAIAIALIVFGIHGFWHAYVADYSLSVDGRVLEAHEMHTYKTRGLYSPFLPFRYVFSYRYRIDGRDYRSGRYAALPYKKVREAVKRYSAGDHIQVWVHPGKPSRAIIDRSAGATDVIAITLGLFLLATLLVSPRRYHVHD